MQPPSVLTRDELIAALAERDRELAQARESQTATAEVLKVISRSVLDLDTVLQTLIDTAVRLTRGSRGTIFLRRGDVLVARAFHSNVPSELRAYLKATPWRLDGDSHMARAARERVVVHVADLSKSQIESDKQVQQRASFGAGLWIPLMREGEVIGVFGVPRDEPIAFTGREIELIQTFADQAVIAIENSRLFEQVQAKSHDLQVAFERQTATADILRVISASPTNVTPVFEAIVATAVRLLGCYSAMVFRVEGDKLAPVTGAGRSGPLDELSPPVPIDPENNFPSRAIVSKETYYVPDYSAIELSEFERQIQNVVAPPSALFLPFVREGECIGLMALAGDRPHAFAREDIALAESFRDQALIAIENARLFNETQESLQQQTATADVLKAISRTAFDLETVFKTLTSTAVRLCDATHGAVFRRRGEVYHYAASEMDVELAYLEYEQAAKIKAGRGTLVGRVAEEKQVVKIEDAWNDPEYAEKEQARVGNVRAMLGVPLMRDGEPIGAFALARPTPIPFTKRQVELVTTFADQAVIAIENVRLFDEVQARTRELTASLNELRNAQDRLVASEKLASLGQLTAGIAHEIKNPLNFVNNFSGLSRELLGELREVLAKAKLADPEREEAEELVGLVASNLDKVVTHGKRADSIVKNMLLHSREGSGERASINVNAMVEEALNLAYHGARAEKPGFHVNVEKSLDPAAGAAELYPQEITRVLLNLISNAFYATTKREASGAYEPTITASTRDLGDSVEISIRDNGTGIPDEVKAKMFNPFFTTKPAGEGTGLGLSLSHDIVVKQHGGTLEVATEPGGYTEFTILLPRSQTAS